MTNQLTTRFLCFLLTSVLTFLTGCATTQPATSSDAVEVSRSSVDQLLPVDCLLPPKIKKLGSQLTFLEPRRPVKTNAVDCEIRGGEYTSYDRADYRTALKVWLDQAKLGDAEAQTNVGEIYEKGLGLPPDYKTAGLWYKKAAAQNFSRAQINMGYLYEKGLGVTKDPVQALNWYRRASGVTDDIAYSSELETRADSIASQRVAEKESEIARLKSSLDASRQHLKTSENRLRQQNTRLNELKLAINQSRNTDQVTTLKQEYAEKQAEIQQIQKEVVTARQQLTDDTQPVIQIFHPVILATRSGESVVRFRSGTNVQSVSGNISSPSGLLQASMNGRPLTIDSQGNFNSAVTITQSNTLVSIKAIGENGKIGDFSFRLKPETETETTVVTTQPGVSKRTAGDIDFGKYYALVIGNNEYQHYPALKTAVTDAKRISQILRTKYGVSSRLITNADRYTILSAINEIKSKLKPQDNLLIYYAGHGEIDPNTNQGYWLPVDAEKGNTANWISNSAISDLLGTLAAKHILVVADSCYSGSMTSASIPRLNTQLEDKYLQKWLKTMSKTKSRTVLTSGGLEPVLDTGGGQHSIFAKAFIKQLETNKGVIDAYRIYLDVSQQVTSASSNLGFSQTPTYAPIQHSGHGGGEFILVSG